MSQSFLQAAKHHKCPVWSTLPKVVHLDAPPIKHSRGFDYRGSEDNVFTYPTSTRWVTPSIIALSMLIPLIILYLHVETVRPSVVTPNQWPYHLSWIKYSSTSTYFHIFHTWKVNFNSTTQQTPKRKSNPNVNYTRKNLKIIFLSRVLLSNDTFT